MKIAIFTKVACEMLNDIPNFNRFVSRSFNKEKEKYRLGWIGNVTMQIDFCGDDFLFNRKTVLQTFDYIPTPRFMRRPAKIKRNCLGRYITKSRYRKVTGN
jgi:hypothetical protein